MHTFFNLKSNIFFGKFQISFRGDGCLRSRPERNCYSNLQLDVCYWKPSCKNQIWVFDLLYTAEINVLLLNKLSFFSSFYVLTTRTMERNHELGSVFIFFAATFDFLKKTCCGSSVVSYHVSGFGFEKLISQKWIQCQEKLVRISTLFVFRMLLKENLDLIAYLRSFIELNPLLKNFGHFCIC